MVNIDDILENLGWEYGIDLFLLLAAEKNKQDDLKYKNKELEAIIEINNTRSEIRMEIEDKLYNTKQNDWAEPLMRHFSDDVSQPVQRSEEYDRGCF